MSENATNNYIQPLIRFENFKVSHVIFENEKPFRKQLPENLQFGLGFNLHFFKSKPRDFIIEFFVNLKAEQEVFIIEVKADALFRTNKDIDSEFMKSHFATQNAPAIAFPFIRSFIATLTGNSGIPVVMLPSVNFQKIPPNQILEHE